MSDEKLDPENQTAADTKEGLYIGYVLHFARWAANRPTLEM